MTVPSRGLWTACFSASKWSDPSQLSETDRTFSKGGRRTQTGSWTVVSSQHSIFVDECGYNMWASRSQGRARQGERAYRQVCGQRGRNMTVALAISPINGLVFHSPSSVGRMPRGSVNTWPKQGWTSTLTSTSYSFTMEPRHIAVLTSWVLTRSSKCCHLTACFSISSNRRSARWKRPSRQIFLVQRSKSAWITEMKQEIEGSLWEFTAPSCSSKHWNKTSPNAAGKCAQWYRFMQTYFPQSKDNNWSTKLKTCYVVENIFSRNEFDKGTIVYMTAWMIVMCAKMVVQGCYCMPLHV